VEDLKCFSRAAILLGGSEGVDCCVSFCLRQRMARARRENVRCPHPSQIVDQSREALIRDADPVHVDDRHSEAGSGQERGEPGCLDPRMNVGHSRTPHLIRGAHRRTQLRQRVAARDGTEEECARLKHHPDSPQRLGQIIDRIQRSDRNAQVIRTRLGDH